MAPVLLAAIARTREDLRLDIGSMTTISHSLKTAVWVRNPLFCVAFAYDVIQEIGLIPLDRAVVVFRPPELGSVPPIAPPKRYSQDYLPNPGVQSTT